MKNTILIRSIHEGRNVPTHKLIRSVHEGHYVPKDINSGPSTYNNLENPDLFVEGKIHNSASAACTLVGIAKCD